MLEFYAGDSFVGLDLIEEAISRGMPFRHHVMWISIVISSLAGMFDRAKKMMLQYPDSEMSDFKRIVCAELEIWQIGKEQWTELKHATPNQLHVLLTHAIQTKEYRSAGFLLRRLFSCRSSNAIDYLSIARCCTLITNSGDVLVKELISKCAAKAYLCDNMNIDAAIEWTRHLITMTCFSEAAAVLKSLPIRDALAPGYADDVFHLMVFCYRAGALTLTEVQEPYELLSLQFVDTTLVSYALPILSGDSIPNQFRARTSNDIHFVRRNYRMAVGQTPKLSVCLSGQLRGFEQAWDISTRALAKHDVTVFVAVWSKTTLGIGAQSNIDRILSEKTLANLPGHMRTTEFIKARYPTLWGLISMEQPVDKARIQSVYNAAEITLLDEVAFEKRWANSPKMWLNGTLNQAKMYYAIAQVLDLRANFERKSSMVFDAVLRTRPDRAVRRLGDADLSTIYSGRTYKTDHFYSWAVGDQTAIFNSSLADDVSALWAQIECAESFRPFDGATGRGAEWLMGEWLAKQDVKFERLVKSEMSGLISAQLDIDAAVGAIHRDLAGREINDVDRRFLNALAN
jgi:hypothetical protein